MHNAQDTQTIFLAMDPQQPTTIADSSNRTCWHKCCAFVNEHRGGPLHLEHNSGS